MTDTTQVEILLACSIVGFALLTLILMAERWYRIFNANSARFTNTNASSNLARKIGRILSPGDEIMVPAGRGGYPLVLSPRRRRQWEAIIQDRMIRGAKSIHIITSPDKQTLEYWQGLLERIHGDLKVYILDRELASPEDAVEMDRLDRFHPTLVLRNGKPLAMWIENDHPPHSPVALNVEYVAPKDMVGYQRARFERYLKVLRWLTDDKHRPPHLRELARSGVTTSPSHNRSARAA